MKTCHAIITTFLVLMILSACGGTGNIGTAATAMPTLTSTPGVQVDPELVNRLMTVCKGKPVEEMPVYRHEAGVHPFIAFELKDKTYLQTWGQEIPPWNQVPQHNTSDIQLVACTEYYRERFESCQYSQQNNTITKGYGRSQWILEVSLYEARTGLLVDQFEQKGGEPEPCSPAIASSQNITDVEGSPVDFDETYSRMMTYYQGTNTESVNISDIMGRLCNFETGMCGTYAAVDVSEASQMEALQNVLDEFFPKNDEAATYVSTGDTGNPPPAEACGDLFFTDCIKKYIQGEKICDTYYQASDTKIIIKTFEEGCNVLVVLLPAIGANSGKSVFDLTRLTLASDIYTEVTRDNILNRLELFFGSN